MNPFFPIIIDGPARGKQIAMQANTFVIEQMPPLNRNWFLNTDITDVDSTLQIKRIVYHIHWFCIGEYEIAFATTKLTRPPLEKALKMVFKPAALRSLRVREKV